MEYLIRHKDKKAIVISGNNGLNYEEKENSRQLSALFKMKNVLFLENISFQNYLDALKQSYAVLDWSSPNKERLYSTSTRVLQAISLGVPVFHQIETALSSFWEEFPGYLCNQSNLNVDNFSTFISKAESNTYSHSIKKCQESMCATLNNKTFFENLL